MEHPYSGKFPVLVPVPVPVPVLFPVPADMAGDNQEMTIHVSQGPKDAKL